jgi:PKD repeat protein
MVGLACARPALAYSRIKNVELGVPIQGKISEEIPVQADVYTGNNVVEYTHNVSVTLLLPSGVEIVSGVNPIFIGEMGPGPAHARCRWTVEFEEPGEYVLMVNASCIDTQLIPIWMNASATIAMYAPPHAEFEYNATSNVHASDTLTFNASNSYARGPNSTIVTYAWNFGDGTDVTTNETLIEHRFFNVGDYAVSLNVTDDKGLSNATITEIRISLLGDLNSDGIVNIVDVSLVAGSYGSRPGEERWNLLYDLDHDGVISIVDVVIVAKEYGKIA